MVFIRRVRTTSGATAVQIAEYVDGRQRIVKHVGSAHSEAELGLLMARARDLLEPSGQDALDVGVEARPPISTLLAEAAGGPAQSGLFPAAVDAAPAAGGGGPGRTSAARVVATDTRVLLEVLAGVYSSLGLDALGDGVFRDLVLARIVEPTSLLDSARVLTDLGRKPASYATMKRTLARVVATSGAATNVTAGAGEPVGTYRDRVAAMCFDHALTSGDVSLVLYDVTTLYFEAEEEDDLRKVGYSNYAEVVVMPSRSGRGRGSPCPAGPSGVEHAA